MNCTGCTAPDAAYEYRGRLFCNEICASCYAAAASDRWLEQLEEAIEEEFDRRGLQGASVAVDTIRKLKEQP